MTRETKIGLLVGLAFIIVVGILLSEHLTSATERPAAPLADAGEVVRNGVAAPGVSSDPIRPAVPQAPIPTARDLQTPPTAPAHVQIGNTNQPPIVIENRQPGMITNGTPGNDPVGPVVSNDPVITHLPSDPFANHTDPRQQAALQQGEQLVPAGNGNTGTTQSNVPVLAANSVREYKAQPGDSLSRIAALLPGGNTKTNRDTVVKLNPSLQKDPNKIIAGKTYLLPTDKAASPPTPAPTPAPVVMVERPSPVEAPKPAPADKFRLYTVKKGDTLTQIAQRECGTVKAIPQIRELNESLKDSDTVRIDMKIKLPLKAVASGE